MKKTYRSFLKKSHHALVFFLLAATLISASSCTQTSNNGTADGRLPDSVYIQQGNRLVAHTFDTLRNSLLRAISTQGMEGAITFCNEKAFSLSTLYGDSVDVRRTSLRVRNPGNSPDSLEQLVLAEMAELLKTKKQPGVTLVRQRAQGQVHFFKPIFLQPMCVNCHGTLGVQVQPSTLTRIKELYPNDVAVNFKEGDLRGAWHITFKE